MSKVLVPKLFSHSIKNRWYVVANRASAVIYANGPDRKFHFIERLSNSEGRLKEAELDSDKPGRGFSSAANGLFHHSLDRRSKHHEQIAKKFAKKIGHVLGNALHESQFGSLVIVAEPHFLGLLREALPQSVLRVVEHEVPHWYEGSDDDLQKKVSNAIESGRK